MANLHLSGSQVKSKNEADFVDFLLRCNNRYCICEVNICDGSMRELESALTIH